MWLCGESEDPKHHNAIIAKILLKKFINSKKIFEKDILWCYNWQKQKMTAGHKMEECPFLLLCVRKRIYIERFCMDMRLKNRM